MRALGSCSPALSARRPRWLRSSPAPRRGSADASSGLTVAQIEKPSHRLVADLQRRLLRPPLQHADEDQRRERQAPEPGLDLRPAGRAARSRRRRCRSTASCTSRRRITRTPSRRAPAASCGTTRSARSRGGIHIGNRGVAMLGNTVYFVTTDCNLVALDIKTGHGEMGQGVLLARDDVLRLGRAGRRQGQADPRAERRRPRRAGLSRRAQSRRTAI